MKYGCSPKNGLNEQRRIDALLFWHSRLWVLEFLKLMSPEFLVISLSAVQHCQNSTNYIETHRQNTPTHKTKQQQKKNSKKINIGGLRDGLAAKSTCCSKWWFLTFLILRPFNVVPYVVLALIIKIFFATS